MYLYADLQRDIAILQQEGAKVFTIGYTQLGKPIQCVMKGSTEGGQLLVQAAMHAREYITTPLVIDLFRNYKGGGGVWCVPMVNIDGVELCQLGLESVSDVGLREFLVETNNGSTDFTNWKANIRGVDLNTNYNANWGTGTLNVNYPAPSDYIGEYPISESENIALWQFTNRLQPSVTLSYHTRGEVAFWGFECNKPYPQETERIIAPTGYGLFESTGSAGGYKDWFVATTSKIGITIEVGSPELEYPLPMTALPVMISQNADVFRVASQVAIEIS